MGVKDRFNNGVNNAHLWGLEVARQAARNGLAGRDAHTPVLAEVRDIDIPGPAGKLRARLYVPPGAPEFGPLLLFFHGGGFVIGDLETHDALCRRLAATGDVRVLAAEYRLAPENPFPAQLDDALAVALWVSAHTDDIGADGGQLGISGDSAGGYLAVAVTSRLPENFKAQILIYPLLHLDDEAWSDTLAQNARVIGRVAARYIGNQLAFTEACAPSMLTFEPLAPLPTFIAVGGGPDPCAPDAEPFAARLREKGAAVEVRAYPWLMHGFANLTHLSAAADRAVTEIGEAAGALLRA